MIELFGELILGILVFCADVVLLRKFREAKGRPGRTLRKDAMEMAALDWWLMPLVALVALACAIVLSVVFELPDWISFGAPLALGGLYCSYKYLGLIRR